MATRSHAGAVHINAAFFCFSSDLHLFFLSHPQSIHCRNLGHAPHMAVSIFDSHQPWGEPHSGLQLFGASSLAGGHDAGVAHQLYAARFPRYAEALQRETGGEHVTLGYRDLRFFHFIPERVHILDEWEFGDEVFITTTVVY
jgi:hypothetical protein